MRLWHFIPLLLPLLTVAGGMPLDAVVVEAWAPPQVEEFDPKHPPADLPILAARHLALADARPRIFWKGAALHGDWNGATGILTLTSVEPVTLTGGSRIRLPIGAVAMLREHEAGHDALNAMVWNESAFSAAAQAAAELMGATFIGHGNTNEVRRAQAWKNAETERDRRFDEALARVIERMDALSARYDQLTNHGRSVAVRTPEGVQCAWRQRNQAATSEPVK